jgi:hypothetical protein
MIALISTGEGMSTPVRRLPCWRLLVDIRDGVQQEVARGATEEQAAAAVKWPQYEKLQGYNAQHDVAVRRLYEQLTGALK